MMNITRLMILLLVSASALAAPGKVVGKLGLVRGQVTINDRPTKSGADVAEGSVIEVKNGQATLLLGKGSVIHLASDSKMVVNQFGVTPAGEEGGELDLKYGRTRALILNQGDEKKDIKIKARAATMGVRGTEVFISAPKESSQPVSFFTLEGKAEVKMPGAVAPRPVNQNEGVVTSAQPQPQSSGSGPTAQASAGSNAPQTQPAVQVAPVSAEQVRTEVQNAGLAPPPVKSAQDMAAVTAGQPPQPKGGPVLPNPNAVNVTFAAPGQGGVQQPVYTVGADTIRQVTIVPIFESAGN